MQGLGGSATGCRLGLAALARNHLGEDPSDGSWFVFPTRSRAIVKVLSFDVGGHWRAATHHWTHHKV